MTIIKRSLHRYRIFCYDCKTHLEYHEVNKAEAMKKFDVCGHDNRKIKRLRKNLGRGAVNYVRAQGKRR